MQGYVCEMKYVMRTMRNDGIVGLFVVVALLVSGCGERVGRLDAQERALPLVAKAENKCLEGEFVAAVALYEKALMMHPAAARVHLDLALVQHDHTKDLIGAVYHYRRYIALRPDTEKDAMIDDRIRLAMQQLDARGVGLEERSLDRLVALEKENTGLRLKAEKLSAELKKTKQKLVTAERARLSASSSPLDRRRPLLRKRPKTYQVQRGDTLGSIAKDLYDDSSKWRDIYDANKAIIPDYDRVPAGLVLTIP